MKKALTLLLLIATILTCAFGLTACAPLSGAKVIDIKLTEEEYAFGVAKGDTELMSAVNDILAEIQADGTMDTIMAKYFSEDSDLDNIEGFSSATKNSSKNQLVVATNAAFKPFEFKNGDKFCGVDIEIANIIATKLGKELVIDDMDFDAVVSSVDKGIADIAMAGLTVSEERKLSVDFSNTYYYASQMLIVPADNTDFDNCKTPEEVINILKSLKKSTIIGFQNGTTGEYFVTDTISNVKPMGYQNGGLAVTDMFNRNINFVVIDEMPAKFITKAMNKN